MDKRVARNDI